jgi:hypothetical protein
LYRAFADPASAESAVTSASITVILIMMILLVEKPKRFTDEIVKGALLFPTPSLA